MLSIPDTAQKCLELSLCPLPIKHNSKKPSVSKWGQYRKKRMSHAEIKQFFRNHNNIALVGGAISGNLECLDFDRPALFRPFLKALEERTPELRAKLHVWQKTPSGGFHIIYRCSEPCQGNKKLAKSIRYQDEKGQYREDTWIETRAEGGYFLIAPSKYLPLRQQSGPHDGVYEMHGELHDIPVLTGEQRAVLHNLAISFDGNKKQTSSFCRNNPPKEKPGEQFNRTTNWTTLLNSYGWDHIQTVGDRQHWRRPGKKEKAASATLNGQGLFVFSTSTPLPVQQPLDKFAVYTWYEHKGDFKVAAKALAGNRQKKLPSNADHQNPELNIKKWPVMAAPAFHGIAGKFVELACRSSEADPAAVLATFLVRFGVECGTSPAFFIGDGKHHARLAVVLVGASSRGRKGTSSKPIERLFKELDNSAQHSPGPFSSGEGIIWAVRNEVRKWNEKGQKWMVVDPGVEDKRLFVLDEEFAGVMANTKREGNTLSMIIRNAWDNGNLDPLTKTNKISATNAHIGWVSHVSLDELHRKLDESEAFNGFANRILWICTKRSKLVPFPQPMPKEELADIRKFVFEAVSLARNDNSPLSITWGPEAQKAWGERYYLQLSKDNPGLVGCIINRAEVQVIRLAMIYCLLDKKKDIDIAHLKAALAFWAYCEQSARYVFQDRQIDMVTQQIVEALRNKPMTGTELFRIFNNHIKKEKLETAISELLANGTLKQEKQKTKGRPKTVWKLAEGEKSEISQEASRDPPQLFENKADREHDLKMKSARKKEEESEERSKIQSNPGNPELISQFFRVNSQRSQNRTTP